MTLLLAVSQLQVPIGEFNSRKKMKKVLINFAFNMNEIAKVFKAKSIKKKEQDLLLFKLNQNSFALQLKNSKIFPVFKIEKMIEYSGEISNIDVFTKGCTYNSVFEGFILDEDKIYAVPDQIFLSGNRESFQEVTWNQ